MALGGNANYLCRRCRRAKGFRLSSGRFSVLRLRMRFFRLIGLLTRCLESISRGVGYGAVLGGRGGGGSRASRRCGSSPGRRAPMCDTSRGAPQLRRPSSGCSNTFYADAIADCLEFIKRTSVAVGEASPAER